MNRTKFMCRITAFAAAAMLSASAFAQSTTQGALAGTVEDPTEAVIPSAAITVHNDGTNATIHLTADQSGYFKVPLLEPGTYTVTVVAPGFGEQTSKGVVVQVGQLTTVMPKLATGATETTVQVSSDAPMINTESPDASMVLNRAVVDNVPSNSRRWSSLALLTPGVTVDSSGYGLIQVRGISPLLNNVMIDGADDNQAYFAEERGRTREGYSTSPNAVREFAVNTGVYGAEYGRAAGGVINSVTRSGTNDFHGELFFSDVDRGFGAYQPGNVDATGKSLKPKDLRKIYGGSVGGPVLKNRLFWWYTYDQYAHIFPAIAKVGNYGNANGSTVGSFLEQPDAAGVTCSDTAGAVAIAPTTGLTHQALDLTVCALAYRLYAGNYANAVTGYNAGVQALLPDFGYVPRTGFQGVNTPKLDWQINSRNRASFVYHRLRWDSPGGVQTTSTANYARDAFGNDFVKLDYGVAKLTTQISNSISNEILYQYGRELNDESQQPYTAYTLNNLVAPGGSASGFTNGPGGTIPYISLSTAGGSQAAIGSPYYSYRTAYPDERKWQLEDTLYVTKGNHTIRMGVDFLHNTDLINTTPYYFGYYSYSNLANYFSDLGSKGGASTCNTTGSGTGTYGCFSSITQEFGTQTAFQLGTLDSAGFIQDNWKATPRLTLELGIRYDYEALPTPFANLTSATGTFVPYAGLTNKPSDKNTIGPRAGFAYDMTGNGTTVLRGGFGMYYGRIINATLGSTLFGSGSPNAQTYVSGTKPTATSVVFPYPEASGSVKPSSYFLAPNLQNPSAEEFDLMLQHQLGKGNVAQIQYMGALGHTLPNFLDVNLSPTLTNVTITIDQPASTGHGNGPLTPGSSFVVPTFTAYSNTSFSDITEVISNVNSSYNGLTVDVQNRGIHGLQYDVNYTWSHSLDYNQNASAGTSVNSWLSPYGDPRQNYGNSAFNVGNRVAGYLVYTVPKMHFDGNTSFLNYIAGGWTVSDNFQMQNGLPYSAQIGTGYNSTSALKSSWNGTSSVYFIPAIGINTYQVPRVIVDDARLQKSFLIREKYDLQINADLYNVANHQNYSPGASGNVNTTAYNFESSAGKEGANFGTLQYNPQLSPYSGFGSHSASNNSSFSYIPREFQVGAKLQF